MIRTKPGRQGEIEIIDLGYSTRIDGTQYVDQVKIIDYNGGIFWIPLRPGISIFEDEPGEIESEINRVEMEKRRDDQS